MTEVSLHILIANKSFRIGRPAGKLAGVNFLRSLSFLSKRLAFFARHPA